MSYIHTLCINSTLCVHKDTGQISLRREYKPHAECRQRGLRIERVLYAESRQRDIHIDRVRLFVEPHNQLAQQ